MAQSISLRVGKALSENTYLNLIRNNHDYFR
jgi:hypothetical protein